MNLPDDLALKEEIREISEKIDSIISTVNEIYPINQDQVCAVSASLDADPSESLKPGKISGVQK